MEASLFGVKEVAGAPARVGDDGGRDYDVLGVAANASQDDIKTAFRRQAKLLHPDVSKSDDSEEDFMRLKEAYDVLSDQRQRAEYDQALRMAARRRAAAAAGPGPGSRRGGTAGGVRGARRVVVMEGDPFFGGMGGFATFDIGDSDDDDDDDMGVGGGFAFVDEDGFVIDLDADSDSDGEEPTLDSDLMEELEFMSWAASGNNMRASFQSSWQANAKKARRAARAAGGSGGQNVLSPDDKELLLRELPRQARNAAQQLFGPRLQVGAFTVGGGAGNEV
ncbi:hypothetical protein GPECTOR_37g157 [Gonium pectorale]|uniref:J domain-containing protein n=1 Tax=Gonium pectorale TaxID=33097 RepID=A0A150GBD1_GONPE|nr:hypothetical protein GPECTOR_37g157 [Gonium pectorale]|eukprot:KXZ47151.1 hypothetical protein GPECTOR_37g157 [Gonium pectorale]